MVLDWLCLNETVGLIQNWFEVVIQRVLRWGSGNKGSVFEIIVRKVWLRIKISRAGY
jgi:hypothetical protein